MGFFSFQVKPHNINAGTIPNIVLCGRGRMSQKTQKCLSSRVINSQLDRRKVTGKLNLDEKKSGYTDIWIYHLEIKYGLD